MADYRFAIVGLGFVALVIAPARLWAGLPEKPGLRAQDAQALAAKIDQLVAARWTAKGVKPAPLADDAEFLRRVHLDLAGRIPRIDEVRDFLDDDTPDKRQRLVERLLSTSVREGDLFSPHFANVWRAILLPVAANQEERSLAPSFEAWLRKRFEENAGYDKMVREILTGRQSNSGENPLAFYQASEGKPEVLAANTSRLFLGVKLECAQCHNHPLGHWTRQQFWEYASFFADSQPNGQPTGAGRRELKIPGTEKVVQARFPNGAAPDWKPGADTRATLAEWVIAADNPYFARTAVNRVWAYFFGTGLVEPVDEVGEQNPPSHPELLDELARQFVAHRFDMKFLVRAITLSQTYQRTSTATHPSQNDPRLFARMAVRGLSPEQLFDSLAQATGYHETPTRNGYFNGYEARTPRSEFLAKFTNQEKRTESQTSILQALHLMNGQFMAEQTSLERNEVLNTVANDTRDTAHRIEELYLNTLSRKPRPEETARLVKYVDSGGPSHDPKKALGDVFWALLNSGEFMLNH